MPWKSCTDDFEWLVVKFALLFGKKIQINHCSTFIRTDFEGCKVSFPLYWCGTILHNVPTQSKKNAFLQPRDLKDLSENVPIWFVTVFPGRNLMSNLRVC